MERLLATVALILSITFGFNSSRQLAFAETLVPSQSSAASPTSGHEELVMKNLPDPNVYVNRNTGRVYLTGTGRDIIPIFQSNDGLKFRRYRNISPSNVDLDYDYCSIWAPDLTRRTDGRFFLSFTADRSPEGEDCNSKKYREMPGTVFYMQADDDQFNFKRVDLLSTSDGPSGKIGKGCFIRQSMDTCEKTIRIDSNLFLDSTTNIEHFFYVWFWRGNNISSFPLKNPQAITRHVVVSEPYEEKIVEAPDVFKRGPYYYLIYSRGSYLHNYGLSYMFGSDLSKLLKGQSKTYHLLDSVSKPGTAICDFGIKNFTKSAVAENSGHSSTVKIGEHYYIYYHKAVFSYDAMGCHSLKFRHTYRSILRFNKHGEIASLQLP